jgi:hypothetical protein
MHPRCMLGVSFLLACLGPHTALPQCHSGTGAGAAPADAHFKAPACSPAPQWVTTRHDVLAWISPPQSVWMEPKHNKLGRKCCARRRRHVRDYCCMGQHLPVAAILQQSTPTPPTRPTLFLWPRSRDHASLQHASTDSPCKLTAHLHRFSVQAHSTPHGHATPSTLSPTPRSPVCAHALTRLCDQLTSWTGASIIINIRATSTLAS